MVDEAPSTIAAAGGPVDSGACPQRQPAPTGGGKAPPAEHECETTAPSNAKDKLSKAPKPDDGSPIVDVVEDITPGSTLLSFDPLLLGAVCTFLVANTSYLFLASAQDSILAAAGPGQDPEPFDAPTLQAFFGNVSELILLPIYVILELGKPHGSSTAWARVERLLQYSMDDTHCQNPASTCHHCDVWHQKATAGLVLQAGDLKPVEQASTAQHLRSSPPRPRVPFYYWGFPAILGLGADIARNCALESVPVSLQNMLDGLIIPFLALTGWLVLRKRLLFIPHLLGVFLVLSGVLLVGVAPLLMGKGLAGAHGQEIDTHAWLVGACFTAASVTCQSIQVTIHEYMLTNYDCNPLEIMSLDTMWTVLLGALAVLAQHLAGLEDMFAALYQITHSVELSGLIAAYSLSHVPAQLMTYLIVGRAGGLVMSMIYQCQTALLWAIDILWNGEPFQVAQLSSFVLIALGTLVYTYVIPIRTWTGLKPSLEDVVHAQHEAITERIYNRYLLGDANVWFQCCWRKRMRAAPELQMSSL